MATFRNSRVLFVLVSVAVVAGAIVAGATLGRDSRSPAPKAAAASTTTATQADGADHDPMEPDAIPASPDPQTLPLKTKGVERLAPEVQPDGTKLFRLTAEQIRWEIIPGKWVTAWAYNGQVPGPQLWVDQGDKVRVEITNKLPEPTTIHWHGVDVPNDQDGVPGVTQDPIQPGATYTYQWVAKPSGTFWYHSHFDSNRQLDMGLYGPLIIKGPDEPHYDKEFVLMIDEWIRLQDGRNGWEGVDHAGHNPGEYNWFTINGKSAPEIPHMVVNQGDRVRIRLIDVGYQAHPMHLHGKRFTVVAKDGAPLASPYQADTQLIATGERYDLEYLADDPGSWMFHCHIDGHLTNDAHPGGGLVTFIDYAGFRNSYQKQEGG
ncbi:MAG TPA: copper oxidase [Acidimicrobiales bacterium]|nr:copper oxidase [Acidimicrobiales bacterium]